jgi:hypothetical protein
MCQANALEIKLSKIKIISLKSLYFSPKVTYPERLDENTSDGISHTWTPLTACNLLVTLLNLKSTSIKRHTEIFPLYFHNDLCRG